MSNVACLHPYGTTSCDLTVSPAGRRERRFPAQILKGTSHLDIFKNSLRSTRTSVSSPVIFCLWPRRQLRVDTKYTGCREHFAGKVVRRGSQDFSGWTPPGLDLESLTEPERGLAPCSVDGHPAPGDAPAASACCCVAGAKCRVPGDQGQGFTFAVRTVRPTCFVAKVSGHTASPWRRGWLVAGLVTEQGSRPPRAAQRASYHPQSSVPVVRA